MVSGVSVCASVRLFLVGGDETPSRCSADEKDFPASHVQKRGRFSLTRTKGREIRFSLQLRGGQWQCLLARPFTDKSPRSTTARYEFGCTINRQCLTAASGHARSGASRVEFLIDSDLPESINHVCALCFPAFFGTQVCALIDGLCSGSTDADYAALKEKLENGDIITFTSTSTSAAGIRGEGR